MQNLNKNLKNAHDMQKKKKQIQRMIRIIIFKKFKSHLFNYIY